jgi:hypothetical protein
MFSHPTSALSETLIHDILNRHDAIQATARTLVQAAIDTRFGDNATAPVLDIVALPEPDQLDLEAEIDSLPIVPVPRSGATIDGLTHGHSIGRPLAAIETPHRCYVSGTTNGFT